jgi:SulP family sulfate permease
VRERAENRELPPLRYLVLDFRLVERIDISAAQSFEKLRMLAEQMGFVLAFAEAREAVAEMFERMDFHASARGRSLHEFPELSMAGSWCEEDILRRHDAERIERVPLESTLGQLEEFKGRAAALVACFQRIELDAGEVLFRQGEEASNLLYLEQGKIEILASVGDRRRRLRTLGPGTFLGEMAMYRSEARSADAETVLPSVVHVLEESEWNRLREEQPELAELLHFFMVRLLSERLSRSNLRLLRALS